MFVFVKQKALVVVQELLSEFPELLTELITLLQMLDDGEVAVIGGIANKRIRSKLKTLFPLLGLSKVRRKCCWLGDGIAAVGVHAGSERVCDAFFGPFLHVAFGAKRIVCKAWESTRGRHESPRSVSAHAGDWKWR